MFIAINVLAATILFAVPIVIWYIRNKKGQFVHTGDRTLRFSREFLLHLLIAMFFAFTYLAFAYFHTPWTWFGFLHVYALIATFILPFALAYLCKGTRAAKTVAIVLSAILLLSPITRPLIFWSWGRGPAITAWEYAIPLNLCNISAIVFIIAILTNNPILKNYMIALGMFGGIINNVQIHNTHVNHFWYYFNWESYIVHALIIIIPIFMLLTNQIKPNWKHAAYGFAILIPVYLLKGFLLNPLWGTNFHFTYPIAFTRDILPTMSNPWIIFNNPVDPLHMLGMFVLVTAASTLLFLFSTFLYKKVRPKFMV